MQSAPVCFENSVQPAETAELLEEATTPAHVDPTTKSTEQQTGDDFDESNYPKKYRRAYAPLLPATKKLVEHYIKSGLERLKTVGAAGKIGLLADNVLSVFQMNATNKEHSPAEGFEQYLGSGGQAEVLPALPTTYFIQVLQEIDPSLRYVRKKESIRSKMFGPNELEAIYFLYRRVHTINEKISMSRKKGLAQGQILKNIKTRTSLASLVPSTLNLVEHYIRSGLETLETVELLADNVLSVFKMNATQKEYSPTGGFQQYLGSGGSPEGLPTLPKPYFTQALQKIDPSLHYADEKESIRSKRLTPKELEAIRLLYQSVNAINRKISRINLAQEQNPKKRRRIFKKRKDLVPPTEKTQNLVTDFLYSGLKEVKEKNDTGLLAQNVISVFEMNDNDKEHSPTGGFEQYLGSSQQTKTPTKTLEITYFTQALQKIDPSLQFAHTESIQSKSLSPSELKAIRLLYLKVKSINRKIFSKKTPKSSAAPLPQKCSSPFSDTTSTPWKDLSSSDEERTGEEDTDEAKLPKNATTSAHSGLAATEGAPKRASDDLDESRNPKKRKRILKNPKDTWVPATEHYPLSDLLTVAEEQSRILLAGTDTAANKQPFLGTSTPWERLSSNDQGSDLENPLVNSIPTSSIF